MANAFKQKQLDDRQRAALAEAQAIGAKATPVARLHAIRKYQNLMGVDQRAAERAVFPGRYD